MQLIFFAAMSVVLLAAGLAFGWYDPYHILLALPLLALVLGLSAWVVHQRREHSEFEDEEESEAEPVLLTSVKGLLAGGTLTVLLLLVFAVADAAGLEDILAGRQRELPADLIQRLQALEDAGAWSLFVQTVDTYLEEQSPPKDLQAQLADLKSRALINWARGLSLCDAAEEAKAHLQAALQTGEMHSLDTGVAEAELGRISATCDSEPVPPPVDLPPGCEATIWSVEPLPPVVAMALSIECPTTSDPASREARTDLTETDFRATVGGGEPAQLWLGSLPGSSDPGPLRALLAIDVSASMLGEPLERAKQGAAGFLESLSPGDEVALLAFNDAVQPVLPFTTDKAAARSAIDTLEAKGGTALYDAIWQAAVEQLGPSAGQQRLVVLLSDGADAQSRQHSLDEAIRKAAEAGVPIHVIGLASSPDYDGATLETIAGATDGVMLEAEAEDLPNLYAQIAGSIRQHAYRVMVKVQNWQDATTDMVLTIGGENAIRIARSVQLRRET